MTTDALIDRAESHLDGMVWVDGVLHLRVSTRWLDGNGEERTLSRPEAARVQEQATARLLVATPEGDSRELPTHSVVAVSPAGEEGERAVVRLLAEGRFVPEEAIHRDQAASWFVSIQLSTGLTQRVSMRDGYPSRPAIVGAVAYVARSAQNNELQIDVGARAHTLLHGAQLRTAEAETTWLLHEGRRRSLRITVPMRGVRVFPVASIENTILTGTAEVVPSHTSLFRRVLDRARGRAGRPKAAGRFRVTANGDEARLHVRVAATPGVWQLVLTWQGSKARVPLRVRVGRDGTAEVLGPADQPAATNMTASPCVSVVIPVHDAEATVEEAVRSAFAQTLPAEDVEIIAVDDGSSDSSLAILRRLEREHPRMRVSTQAPSGTAAAPRNAGMEMVTGRYTFFLDADDLLTPTALEKMSEAADALDADVVLGKLEGFAGRTRVPRSVFSKSSVDADMVGNYLMTSLGPTKLFRTQHIKDQHLRFPLGLRAGEDQSFVAEAEFTARRILILTDTIYYRVRGRKGRLTEPDIGSEIDSGLRRASLLAGVVSRHTDPGERRDALLPRSFGERLLESVFRSDYLAMDAVARSELMERVVDEFGHLWTPRLRARIEPAARVMYDLLFLRDEVNLTALVRHAGGNVRQLAVVPRSGAFYVDTPIGVEQKIGREACRTDPPPIAHRLTGLESSGQTLTVLGRMRLRRPARVPFGVHAEWRRRAQGTPVAETVPIVGTVLAATPISSWRQAVPFSIATEISALPEAGVWELWIAPVWDGTIGNCVQFGPLRHASVGSGSIVFTDPHAVVSLQGKDGVLSIERDGPLGAVHPRPG